MDRNFTRQSLYDLVWSEPMRSIAKRLSISDRGLAKICIAKNIPVPARGYWAKLQAGKRAVRCPLPARSFGQSDEVHVGRGNEWHDDRESDANLLNEPIPPVPVFEPDMEVVRSQAAVVVRKAPLPMRDGHGWHGQVAKLLNADEERIKKQRTSRYPSSWDAPIFDNPFEKRRLRILNGMFICLSRCGMRPSVSGKYGRELSVTVGDTQVPFTLDTVGASKQSERERCGYAFQARNPNDRMRLSLSPYWSPDFSAPSWEDKTGNRLERQLREIVVEMIVFAEQSYRDATVSLRQWRIERRAELQEAEEKRKAEAERRRRERLARLEQARVDHLLRQAKALRQATQIRAYVGAVRDINRDSPDPMTPEDLDAWSGWALAQADRIDPVVSGSYRCRPPESENPR